MKTKENKQNIIFFFFNKESDWLHLTAAQEDIPVHDANNDSSDVV